MSNESSSDSSPSSPSAPGTSDAPKGSWLPPIGSKGYYLLLGLVAVLFLGPLGGVAAAYMNFSLGFFIGGQVLAGILGSVVTLGYGPEGKHGANYMQTMAASVSGMSAMGVLIQAMVWLGMEQPPTWQLIIFFLCIGMFGVGVGMLYTPILVDKLKLTYPSGLAVANILRALTDREILKKSVGNLVGGIGLGLLLSKLVQIGQELYGWANEVAEATKVKLSETVTNSADLATAFSTATFGGGMIVGARISASAILVGLIGVQMTPWLRTHGYVDAEGEANVVVTESSETKVVKWMKLPGEKVEKGEDILIVSPDGQREIVIQAPKKGTIIDAQGEVGDSISAGGRAASIGHPWLGAHDPFRKIGFIFALGTILGAAIIDMSLLALNFLRRVRGIKDEKEQAEEPQQKSNIKPLLAWVAFWGVALIVVANQMLNVPVPWVVFAICMAFVFLMINGISQGITDQNPISSAFVVTVLIMVGIGLRQPLIGLLAGSILLVSCTVGVDMQQDRSTGARLGSNRTIQFRYQMLGVIMGAFLAVVMTRAFMESYPVLSVNLFEQPELRDPKWQSAMTFKFVGILELAREEKDTLKAAANAAKASSTVMVMGLGIAVGLFIQVLRKLMQRSKGYQEWRVSSIPAKVVDFILDALLLASPYASSFGGFVDFTTSLWFGLGGIFSSIFNWNEKRKQKPSEQEAGLEDMSTTSLVGGGLIAGEALFYLAIGIMGLVGSGAIYKLFS